MHATSSPDSGEDRIGPAAAWAAAEGETVICVCWLPGDPSPEPIIGEGRPDGEGRFGVPAEFGDSMRRRSPTHYEWHALGMDSGEPVVELRRSNGMREVFRSRLVGIVPTGSTMQAAGPGAPSTVYGEDSFCVFEGEVDTPDPHTPRWRRIVADVHADVDAGRLRPGDELPTAGQLATLYHCSASTVYYALRHLARAGLVVGRPGWGRFIAGSTGTADVAGPAPSPSPLAPAGSEPGMDRIGIKHPPGGAYYAIKFVVTPNEVAAIGVSDDDILTVRAPNHLEARRLHTDSGEPVIEIQYADSTVEVYRSSRIVLRARGDIALPGGTVPDGVAFRLTGDPVDGPDPAAPYWRHVYDDITAGIAAGRLTTGTRIGTTVQLADTYVLSASTIEHALHHLRTDRLIESHDGTWYVTGPPDADTHRPSQGPTAR